MILIESDTSTADLKRAIAVASLRKQKWSMFNYIALRQAERLSLLDGAALEAFCLDIGMAASAATEARKMFALASVIEEQTEAKRSGLARQ